MIAIIGGGCSGLLAAAQLLRQGFEGEVAVVESRERLGRGMAYSTPWREHLLNVPARNMSAFPDKPSHFVEWLKAAKFPKAGDDVFAPRGLYGDYLDDVLRNAIREAKAQKRFRHVRAEAVDIEASEAGVTFILDDGSKLRAEQAVIALGNRDAQSLPGRVSKEARARCFASAWKGEALRLRSKEERVLVIGTGLTAVDAVLALEAQGHAGKIELVSRRGQLPQPHRAGLSQKIDPIVAHLGRLRSIVRNMREQIEKLAGKGIDWRVAVDSLRPVTNDFWQNLDIEEQRRFYRHLKAYWDIHRHRMAPEIGEIVGRLRRAGRLRVHAGRVVEIGTQGKELEVKIARRGGGELKLAVDRVINCTGIEEKFNDSAWPLIRQLIAKKLGRVNEMGNGFEADAHGEISPRLFAIGPTRAGSLLETVAVPEIRAQAEMVARRLLAKRKI